MFAVFPYWYVVIGVSRTNNIEIIEPYFTYKKLNLFFNMSCIFALCQRSRQYLCNIWTTCT